MIKSSVDLSSANIHTFGWCMIQAATPSTTRNMQAKMFAIKLEEPNVMSNVRIALALQ
jgi:hypothetical protein